MEDEGGRGVFGDLLLVAHEFGELGVWIVAAKEVAATALVLPLFCAGDDRIAEDGEVWTSFGGEVSRDSGGEVTAGAKAPDADSSGIDTPFGSAPADQAEGFADIVEHGGMLVTRAKPILEHEGVDAHRVEPAGDLDAFVIHGESTVTTTGANDDGGTAGLVGKIGGEFGAIALVFKDALRRVKLDWGLR